MPEGPRLVVCHQSCSSILPGWTCQASWMSPDVPYLLTSPSPCQEVAAVFSYRFKLLSCLTWWPTAHSASLQPALYLWLLPLSSSMITPDCQPSVDPYQSCLQSCPHSCPACPCPRVVHSQSVHPSEQSIYSDTALCHLPPEPPQKTSCRPYSGVGLTGFLGAGTCRLANFLSATGTHKPSLGPEFSAITWLLPFLVLLNQCLLGARGCQRTSLSFLHVR